MYVLNVLLLCRRTQKEQAEQEKAEELQCQASQTQVTPSQATPSNNLLPPQLPQASPVPIQTSSTPTIEPKVENVTATSQFTPSQRPRGRPQKDMLPPSMDDKPINTSKSEMLKWQKKYNAAKWRFDKLSSEDAESYRDAENARVKKTMEIQCQHIIEASTGKSTYYQHIPNTPRSVAHEKSRQR